MATDTFCADSSLAAAEPLAGTAAEASVWLIVEHDGPWGPKGLEDSGLSDAVVAQLGRFGKRVPGARVQLARRPDREGPSARVWLAVARPGEERLDELELPAIATLADLDLEAWAAGVAPAGARPVDAPMFFVCVHGKRDRCCAQRGFPVYSALDREVGQRTFMTTHLGGHRFAATLLVLPHGIAYGRVEPEEAAAMVEAHGRGELHALARLRGRTSYGGAAQAAEVALRERLGEMRLAALALVRSENTPEGERVTFHHGASEHTLTVATSATLPVVSSCGADPKPGKRFVVR